MRSYYRLLILNLSVMAPFAVAMFLHIFRTPALVVLQLALLAANCVIALRVARQGDPFSLKKSNWRLGLWGAWILGPLVAGWLPLILASLIARPSFTGIMNLGIMAYSASSLRDMVNNVEQKRVTNWSNPQEGPLSAPTKTRPGWVWFICIW